ncbi:hypothetical protein EBU94_05475, partial [bacterium]|nr:hypothetical protein [bacterium]
MRLVKLLSSVVSEKSTPKHVLKEISEKLKKTLIDKFQKETQDSSEKIGEYITQFDSYKNGLPVEKRDLGKYTYSELKKLIESKKFQKQETELYKSFKKKEEKIENAALKKTVRKFLEIKEKFGKSKDPSGYKFLDFYKVINQVYPKYLSEILMEKFKKENTNLTEDILEFYIGQYITNFDELYEQMPSPTNLTFNEFEHYIDGMDKGLAGEEKSSTEDIEIVYDKNNLLIFQPKTRDQCIRLKNGRSWCTSREGGSNLFYNYRLDNKRTLYYVIDQDKDYSDVNFAVVVLVDPDGDASLADGTNSGRYSGHQNIPWKEITEKIPKLKGLENLFKPSPLTSDELEVIKKIKSFGRNVGQNPMEIFGSEDMVELWLEIETPRLSDEQFGDITPKLRKKYIALGHDLSAGMIKIADAETRKYYIGKKLESIKTKSLSQLSEVDIAILNLPGMAKLKEELKSKFATDFVSDNDVVIKIPSQKEGKFIALYGFDELIDKLPETIEALSVINSEKTGQSFSIPLTFTKFRNLRNLVLSNIITELPENIGDLKNLESILLQDNTELKTLPKSILTLENLEMIVLRRNSPDFQLPEGFEEH